jgi:hypothetical protein
MSFKAYDRVRLKAGFARAMAYRHRKLPTDWEHRQGAVLRANSTRVFVIWDGRRSSEELPPGALELIPLASARVQGSTA